jgi:hypothetical protein
MIVTYPWPVASAHIELTGPQRPDSAEIGQRDAAEVTIEQRARHLEAIVCWTDLERVRFHWYRLEHRFTFVMVTHDSSIASRAQRTAFMRNGALTIIGQGSTAVASTSSSAGSRDKGGRPRVTRTRIACPPPPVPHGMSAACFPGSQAAGDSR